MQIVRDEQKRQRSRAKHGLDFADLPMAFFDADRIEIAKDGRFPAIGEWDGMTIVAVVFSPLGAEALSVISMRRASRIERRHA